jgi:hypothetical protein
VSVIVREICEQVIASGNPDRQWHCRELLDEVEDQLGPVDFGAYILDLLLVDSRSLARLGRQVYVLRGGRAISHEDRAQIHDLAQKTLHDAGCPMKAQELLKEIGKARGVGAYCQLHPNEHLIRIKPNLWGLTARDIPASIEQRQSIQDGMYNVLVRLGRSLHFSEFSNYDDALRRPLGITDYLIYSICKMDKRFHGWSGGILGLEEWGERRGVTVSEAFQQVLESLTSPKTLLEIHQQVEATAMRKIDKAHISALLSQSSCFWDPATETWAVPAEEVV